MAHSGQHPALNKAGKRAGRTHIQRLLVQPLPPEFLAIAVVAHDYMAWCGVGVGGGGGGVVLVVLVEV